MRYINISEIEQKLSDEIKRKFENAANEVKKVYEETEAILSKKPSKEDKNKVKKDRSEVIKKNSHLWTEIKKIYENHFYKKCWYTESIDAGAPKDMDHFRPKSEVYEDKKHPGYWWLAFDWKNYRFSCQFSNRKNINPNTNKTGGKGSHFPLLDETTRAYSQDDDYKDELNMLLDPCIGGDYALLYFEEHGKPMMHPNFKNDSNAIKRVDASIKYYNIDHPNLNEQRAILYSEIKDIIEEANRVYHKYISDEIKNKNYLSLFRKRIEELERKKDIKSQYSRAAEIYINSFKKYNWIEKYFCL